MSYEEDRKRFWKITNISIVVTVLVIVGLFWGLPAYGRYQARADAENQVILNDIQIRQTQQLVQVEKQKAEVRVQDAMGHAQAQKLIDSTLTDQYLQHEAIAAQLAMAMNPGHTQIYIPVGNNGIPIVKTIDNEKDK